MVICDKRIATDSIAGDKILLATKAPYLFEGVSDPRVDVIPLENEKPTPAVETWRLLEQVNNILRKVIGTERSWAYEVSYSIEWGTAQSCLRILSIIEIIERILTQYSPDKIILYPIVDNMIECMLAEEIAQKKKIKLKKHYTGIRNYHVTNNLGIAAYLKYVECFIREMIKFATLKKRAESNTDKQCKDYQLGIFHWNNTKKEIDRASTWVYGMKAEFKTYRMAVLNAGQAAAHFRSEGIDVDNMEDWMTKETLQSRKEEYGKLIKKCLQAIRNEFEFFFNDLNITKTVRHFIYIHLLCDVPTFLEIDSICHDYFKKNRFKVINCYEESNSIGTRAIFYATRDVQTVMYYKGNLRVDDFPRYEPYPDMIGIRFFCKDSAKYDSLIKQGWNGQAHFIGDIWWIPKFAERYKNRDKVVTTPKEISVLWAPSVFLRVYTTYNTFRRNNIRMLQQFKENGWKLYVKFHPSQIDDPVKELYELYSDCENIQFVDKNESIYDWIKKVDIIISDRSGSFFDSIIEGKPVMALCSSPLHYSHMKQHEKGIIIYQNIEDMFSELSKIENDGYYYQQWRKKTVTRQDDYFRSYMQEEGEDDPIKEMANILKKECGL